MRSGLCFSGLAGVTAGRVRRLLRNTRRCAASTCTATRTKREGEREREREGERGGGEISVDKKASGRIQSNLFLRVLIFTTLLPSWRNPSEVLSISTHSAAVSRRFARHMELVSC